EEGELVLSLEVWGKKVFEDTEAVSLLPNPAESLPAALKSLKPGELALFDPQGEDPVANFLKSCAIPFVNATPWQIPASARILLVGPNAMTRPMQTSTAFAAWAARGRAVVVLDQMYPLMYQALPAEISPAKNSGFTAFIEDAGHPVFTG